MKNMEHPWRKYCLGTTASTEPASVEASKAEVATTEGAEDGFQIVERS